MAREVKLTVCQSTSCSGQGSPSLLQDIEDLVGSKCQVEPGICLNHCGQGPNVEVTKSGKQRVVTGISTFEKMVDLLKKESGIDASAVAMKVAQMKFDARRIVGEEPEDFEDRAGLIEDGFKALGGQEKAIKSRPKLASSLLVMRAQDQPADSAEQALEDAELALEINPKSVRAQLCVAKILTDLSRLDEAILAMNKAVDMSSSAAVKKDIQKSLRALQDRQKTSVTAKPKKKAAAAPKQSLPSPQSAPVAETWSTTPDIDGYVKPVIPNIDTLLERIGGQDKLTTLVYGVYDLMRADFVLGPKFEFFARNPNTFQRLKERTVDYLNGEWGGIPYSGPDLFVAHASILIDKVMYDGMMRMWAQMLDNVGVVDPERSEALESIEGMRPPICDPDGKFQEAMEERLLQAQKEREEKVRKWKLQKKREQEEMERKALEAKKKREQQKKEKEQATKAKSQPSAAETRSKKTTSKETAETENPKIENHGKQEQLELPVKANPAEAEEHELQIVSEPVKEADQLEVPAITPAPVKALLTPPLNADLASTTSTMESNASLRSFESHQDSVEMAGEPVDTPGQSSSCNVSCSNVDKSCPMM
eukprot:TRINITY_DN29787_c0_g1_i1.p1 TRINITY_DN29787_c0_g1~~TRINITY_DN29787_c0_g1_i1.p1  ORF type:complete len:593 (+),score=155.56 TRINITY_DN29787_c0_g1_i1:70-1848(+)